MARTHPWKAKGALLDGRRIMYRYRDRTHRRPLARSDRPLRGVVLLAQLQQGGAEEKRQATHILQSVVYRDNEMVAALKVLAHASDEGVRSGAAKALAIMEHSS
jgi:hypothetical protein